MNEPCCHPKPSQNQLRRATVKLYELVNKRKEFEFI